MNFPPVVHGVPKWGLTSTAVSVALGSGTTTTVFDFARLNGTMGTPLKSRRQGGNMLLFNRRSAGARPCVQKSECITIVVLNTKNCVFC